MATKIRVKRESGLTAVQPKWDPPVLAEETATTSGEEHVSSPPKVSKGKEISAKGQKAAPKLVVNQHATKHALLADETATTSGEEHVA